MYGYRCDCYATNDSISMLILKPVLNIEMIIISMSHFIYDRIFVLRKMLQVLVSGGTNEH